MKEVQWNDSMSVGIELIDKQHKMLIQHLNNLIKSLEPNQGLTEVANTLSFLIDYTHFHFSEEEKHMAANKYPELEQHKMKHNEFKTTLSNLEEEFKEDGATHVLAKAVNTLLVNWLIKHICRVDVEFGVFLKNNGIALPDEG
ncbi:MAG: hemerythrin family protein [Desulfobacterales bacterium]|nr:hemerythrin family protein [Desulfobacterales bacterium]